MRIVFMGTPESAVPSLRRLVDDGHEVIAVWTQPDRPAGRGKNLRESPIKQFALQRRLTIHQPTKLKTSEAAKLFSSHQADAAIVVAYGRILPREFLNSPKQGCINVHFSLLPKYRGAAPVNWAIINGEEQTGVTTMQIVKELDAGPLLLQRATKIADRETAPELLARLADIGAELLSETLRELQNIEPKPQRDEEATLAPILKREDGLIDWSMDAFAIERRVRGLQPWPKAYSQLKAHRVIIHKATAERVAQSASIPGQVIEARGDRLAIACGDATALRVVQLQLEGGRCLDARDFMNGVHLKSGDKLSA